MHATRPWTARGPAATCSLIFVHCNIGYGGNIGRSVPHLDSYLVDMETDLMRTERPYPGQLWKHDSLRVIVVAVSPNTVTYEDLSGRAGVTRDSLSNFLAGFTRLKSPAR